MLDVIDAHMHTLASGHAYSTIKEMIIAAQARQLQLIGITEHAPEMPGSCGYLYFRNLRVIPRQFATLEVRMGAELNIMNYEGAVDLEERSLNRLDYAIASLHEICITPGTIEQNTQALIAAMKIPVVKIIGHPDNGRFPVDYSRLACAAKQHQVLLELNNTSLDSHSSREHAHENMITLLEACKRYQTSVIMDSDAHIDSDVGNHQRIYPLLSQVDFPEELIVNTSVDKFKAFVDK